MSSSFWSDVLTFVLAYLSHWQSYVTGGTVTAVIFVVERIFGFQLPKRAFISVFVVAFSLAALFMAWRDEFRRANALHDNNLVLQDRETHLVDPKSRDDEIGRLRTQIETLKSTPPKVTSTKAEIKPEVTIYLTGIPSKFLDAPEGRAFFITSNYTVGVPYRLEIICEAPTIYSAQDFWMTREGNFITQMSARIDRGMYHLDVSSPPLSPGMGIFVTLFAKVRMGHCTAQISGQR